MKTKERLTAEDVRSDFEAFARSEPLEGYAMNLCQYPNGQYIIARTEIAWRCFLKALGLFR